MILSSQSWFALLIVGLFLQDSVLLLEPDEALLMRRGSGPWRAGFGLRTWRIGGREVFLMNPLLPDLAVYRLRWQIGSPPAPAAAAAAMAAPGLARADGSAFRRLGLLVWPVWLALLILVPGVFFAHLGPVPALATLVFLYLSILLSLAAVWRWRTELRLGGKAAAGLAFECLACAPYAANLLRKVAALQVVEEDFETAARRLLSAERWVAARRECLARVDEQIEVLGEDDPACTDLQQARRRFTEAAGECD